MMLEILFQKFMDQNRKGEKPLLLALSGGPDSLALFYLLLKFKISFEVAHVDHGWRSESGQEASILQRLAKDHDLPFHTRKLSGVVSELICREERIKFLIELYKKHGYQAVVLGHQKDDQIETVFKRILEGSAIENLTGMSDISQLNGMIIWRPLLSVHKREILQWNQDHNLHPFIDSSNENTKFLRNRMRREIIPELAIAFGKEVSPSFFHLGEEAKELQFFLHKHLAPILDSVVTSPLGLFLDLSLFGNLTPFEIKTLLRQFCKKYFTPSRDYIEKGFQLIKDGTANKVLINGTSHLYIDRKRLFLIPKECVLVPKELQPLQQNTVCGSWTVKILETSGGPLAPSNWKQVFKGEMEVALPQGEYQIGYSMTPETSKRWNTMKIPSFLGAFVPGIWSNGKLIHEFLTGDYREKNQKLMHIKLVWSDSIY